MIWCEGFCYKHALENRCKKPEAPGNKKKPGVKQKEKKKKKKKKPMQGEENDKDNGNANFFLVVGATLS